MNGPTKVCTGPTHAQPTRLPLTEQHWYFFHKGPRAGQPFSRCRICHRLAVMQGKPMVPAKPLRPFALELLYRCGGCTTVERQHGIKTSTLNRIVHGEHAKMQRRTAEKLLRALVEQRKLDRRNGTSARFKEARRLQALLESRMEELTGY